MEYNRILYTIYMTKETNIKEGSWRVKQESFENPHVSEAGRVKNLVFNDLVYSPIAGFQPDCRLKIINAEHPPAMHMLLGIAFIESLIQFCIYPGLVSRSCGQVERSTPNVE